MTDDSPRKTLTLKKTASPPNKPGDDRRKRTGARARNVAQQERRQQHEQTVVPEPDVDAAPRQGGPGKAARTGATPDQRAPGQRIRRSRKPVETFTVFASCPQGLEEALATEMKALGYDDAQPARAGCRFRADWAGVMRANLYSRLATRILVEVSRGPVRTEDDVFALAFDTPWEHWFGPGQTLRVDTSAIRSPMHSLQFCNLRAKDGICDHLRDSEGARPSIDTRNPDVRVHLFLNEDSATLYLDTSGEALFKRGWRLNKGAAPIRENLAAGILALSGWDPSQPLFDPFCGSGTILIEAAWIALGVPAGIWRAFGFEQLRNHNTRLWRDIRDEARASIATNVENQLIGYDIDAGAIAAARQNIQRARLAPGTIRFEVGDARGAPACDEPGWLVTNPPYGERMAAEDDALWADWAHHLKRGFSGWHINIISSDLGLPGRLRLKPRRKIPLHNGALDCRLFQFDMVAAGYRRCDAT
jgi:putative N6-adenine-specific DNA methylase